MRNASLHPKRRSSRPLTGDYVMKVCSDELKALMAPSKDQCPMPRRGTGLRHSSWCGGIFCRPFRAVPRRPMRCEWDTPAANGTSAPSCRHWASPLFQPACADCRSVWTTPRGSAPLRSTRDARGLPGLERDGQLRSATRQIRPRARPWAPSVPPSDWDSLTHVVEPHNDNHHPVMNGL
jgi:hypothetical protein